MTFSHFIAFSFNFFLTFLMRLDCFCEFSVLWAFSTHFQFSSIYKFLIKLDEFSRFFRLLVLLNLENLAGKYLRKYFMFHAGQTNFHSKFDAQKVFQLANGSSVETWYIICKRIKRFMALFIIKLLLKPFSL